MKFQNLKQGRSLSTTLILLLLAVLTMQVAIYYIVFSLGGILDETKENSFNMLNERTSSRKLYLESEMVQRWSKTDEAESEILRSVQTHTQQRGISPTALCREPSLCQEILADTASSVINLLRNNSVTGAYLILNCPVKEDSGVSYPGFYVRDYDPSSYSEKNTDLLMERGLPAIAHEQGISMDSFWSAFLNFKDPADDACSFYFTPVEAAESVPRQEREKSYFSYWSQAFSLNDADRRIITYSVPLLSEEGDVLGVIGIDLTLDYLANQLKYDELADNKAGAYLLAISRDGGHTYEPVVSGGPVYQAYFGTSSSIRVTPDIYQNIVTMDNAGGSEFTLYGAVQPLKLYDTNTPFEKEQWALIGILDSDTLLSFPHRIQTLFLLGLAAAMLIGIIMIFITAKSTTKPITKLVEKLRTSDPEKPIRLEPVRLNEIDTLTSVIVELSNRASEAAARTSKIINMANLPVGVYEYHSAENYVFCNRNLFLVLGWQDVPEGDTKVPLDIFRERIKILEQNTYDAEKKIFQFKNEHGEESWVQLFNREEEGLILGAFMDITRDMKARQKMLYERDYDILTNLYNRRAFDQNVQELFEPENRSCLKVASLLMFDLDNLKYVNDSYGHDSGDQYIRAFADSLSCFRDYPHVVIGRRSGDEFNVFLYGYEDRMTIQKIVETCWSKMSEIHVTLKQENMTLRVRASGGMAWYPYDSENYTELLRMADFAMYHIKHTVKGKIREFDRDYYNEKSVLIQGQDALNRFIENRMVRYVFQPIVSAVTGEVFGYEMLMRPLIEPMSNLSILFQLAKSQSKLYQIEQLTWFESLKAFEAEVKAGNIGPDEHAFINSIGNQILTDEDLDYLESRYRDILPRVITEITESEEFSLDIVSKKKTIVHRWNAKMAIDDFGTGFNSENVLISLAPDIVKVDISIIHNIDVDVDRQALLKNLISYAKARNIKVLAEGVETAGELKTVITFGVDYIQGFYIAEGNYTVRAIPESVVNEIRSLHQS